MRRSGRSRNISPATRTGMTGTDPAPAARPVRDAGAVIAAVFFVAMTILASAALVTVGASTVADRTGRTDASSPAASPAPGETGAIGPGSTTHGRPGLASLPPDLPPAGVDELKERRRRLVELLRPSLGGEESGLFLWRAGESDPEADEFYPDPSFFYLTGHEEPGAVMLLQFSKSTLDETLLLPPRNPAQEKWTGRKHGPGHLDPENGEPDAERREAIARTGFASVDSTDTLMSRLEGRTGLGSVGVLWAKHESGGLLDLPTPSQSFLDLVRSRFPTVRIADPDEQLRRLRFVKSPTELALMERAAQITCEAHLEAMRAASRAAREFELRGIIDGSFYRQGALGSAFPSIVAAGRNATVLHYSEDRAPIADGDLILIDIGASYGRYAADVTRTIPASGRYTRRQREIYDLVLRAQKEAAALIKPGATTVEIHRRAKEILAEAGYDQYFTHGTSHFLGLGVHDPANRDWKLEPGAVLTVEPGLYLPEEGIGVRIEDDFVVTADGARRISTCVPSEPGEIEAIVSGSSR